MEGVEDGNVSNVKILFFIRRMLLLSKLKRGLPVRVGELGRSLVVRIPKDIAMLYKLSKGEQIIMKAESDTKIELDVSS